MTTDTVAIMLTVIVVAMVGYFFVKSITTNYPNHKHSH